MDLNIAHPSKMVLLTEAQHQSVLLNIKVKLTWFNTGEYPNNKWVGPYIDPVDMVHVKQEPSCTKS
jgi:hypothetical protein